MFNKFHLTLALGFSILFMGCRNEGGEYRDLTDADDVPNTTPAHVHEHATGPNGGHLLEFGKFHGEITMNADRTVAVYVLGDDAKTAVPVADATATLHLKSGTETIDIPLTATPLEGETDGMSSKFVSEASALPESVKDIEGIAGSVDLKIGEEVLNAKISHDHGHDH